MEDLSALELRIRDLEKQLYLEKKKNQTTSRVSNTSQHNLLQNSQYDPLFPYRTPTKELPRSYTSLKSNSFANPSPSQPFPIHHPNFPVQNEKEIHQKQFQEIGTNREHLSPGKAIQSMQSQNSRLQETLLETRDKLKSTEKTNLILKSEIDHIRGENTEFQAQKRLSEKLQGRIADSQDNFLRVKSELDSANYKLTTLTFELEDSQEQYQQLIKDIRREKASMRKEISALRGELEERADSEANERKQLQRQIDDMHRNIKLEVYPEHPRKSTPETTKDRQNESTAEFNKSEELSRSNLIQDPNLQTPPKRGRSTPHRVSSTPGNKQTLETMLINMQLQKTRIESEIIRLPTRSRDISSKNKRESLQLELDVTETNINNLKAKIRSFKTN